MAKTGIRMGDRIVVAKDLVGMAYSRSGKERDVEYVHAMEPPGYGGPEVAKRLSLPKGSAFTIVGVTDGCGEFYVRLKPDPINALSEYADKEVWAILVETGDGRLEIDARMLEYTK